MKPQANRNDRLAESFEREKKRLRDKEELERLMAKYPNTRAQTEPVIDDAGRMVFESKADSCL
jgi:hypothetical protein